MSVCARGVRGGGVEVGTGVDLCVCVRACAIAHERGCACVSDALNVLH